MTKKSDNLLQRHYSPKKVGEGTVMPENAAHLESDIFGHIATKPANFAPSGLFFPDALLDSPTRKRRKSNIVINGILVAIIVILLAVIVFMNLVVLCPVRQNSMYPTIKNGERVLLVKTKKINVGDIFVFKTSEKDDNGNYKNLIKRAVAVGGDRLLFVGMVQDGSVRYVQIYRDSGGGFNPVTEDFINEPIQYSVSSDITYYRVFKLEMGQPLDIEQATDEIIHVPDGHVYALGDNRNHSKDSRQLGFISKNSIIGRMTTKLKSGSAIEKFLMFLYRDQTSTEE